MKSFLALMLAGLCTVAVSPAIAGSQKGTVVNLTVRNSDGLIFVQLSGTPSDRPQCALQQTYWMIANETSDAGKRTYALLLSAQASGRIVQIYGSNTCNRWLDGEDIELASMVEQ
jgi:hypothetical protein